MKIVLAVMILNFAMYGQLYMAGVAPLKPHNFWKYAAANDPTQTDTYLVLDSILHKDSISFNVIHSLGNYTYLRLFYMGESSDSFYVRYDNWIYKNNYKYLKKNVNVGDSWVSVLTESTGYQRYFYYSVVDSGLMWWDWFGMTLPVKYITITDSSLTQIHQYWNDTLGLIMEADEESYINELRGCVINGVVYGDTSRTVGIREQDFTKSDFQLLQNYPNPFNPGTNISYYLPQGVEVEISVYNLLGQKIKVLEKGYQNAGAHEAYFDGTGLASGVYFYFLRAGTFSTAKKMILAR